MTDSSPAPGSAPSQAALVAQLEARVREVQLRNQAALQAAKASTDAKDEVCIAAPGCQITFCVQLQGRIHSLEELKRQMEAAIVLRSQVNLASSAMSRWTCELTCGSVWT